MGALADALAAALKAVLRPESSYLEEGVLPDIGLARRPMMAEKHLMTGCKDSCRLGAQQRDLWTEHPH